MATSRRRTSCTSPQEPRLCLWHPISAFVEASVPIFEFDEAFGKSRQTVIPEQLKDALWPAELPKAALRDSVKEVYSRVLEIGERSAWSIEPLGQQLQSALPAWDIKLISTRAAAFPRAKNASFLNPLILPNKFLTATRLSTAQGLDDVLLIDVAFRRHFELPGLASLSFKCALADVPEVFVGTRQELERQVAAIFTLMLKEYKAKDMSLPPWRTRSALFSLWSAAHAEAMLPEQRRSEDGDGLVRATSAGDLPQLEEDAGHVTLATRSKSAPAPAKVMMGFSVKPQAGSAMFDPAFSSPGAMHIAQQMAQGRYGGDSSPSFGSPFSSSSNLIFRDNGSSHSASLASSMASSPDLVLDSGFRLPMTKPAGRFLAVA